MTSKSMACIAPPQAFMDALDDVERPVDIKVEFLWDGISWTDESTYVIGANGNDKMTSDWGEMNAAEADIELDNTSGRFQLGMSSPIDGYLKPGIRMRISVAVGDVNYYVPIFYGIVKSFNYSKNSESVDIHAFDKYQLIKDKSIRTVLELESRTDELVELVAGDAGVTDMILDDGTDTIPAAWFDKSTAVEALSDISIAERGRIFFDTRGRLRFWNRTHLHNQSFTNATAISKADWLLEFGYDITDESIVNHVIVRAKPRASAGIQQVWSSGDPTVTNQYTNSLVWIPAHSSQNAFIELEDPATNWIQPIPTTDYVANAEADGTGADLTDNVSIVAFDTYDNEAFIVVANTGDTDLYFTRFVVRANPVRVWQYIETDYSIPYSISEYGEHLTEIENHLITSENLAISIADEELSRWKDATTEPKVKIVGIPQLYTGDCVKIEIGTSVYQNFLIQELSWRLEDGGYEQDLVLAEPITLATNQQATSMASIAE